MCFDLHRQKYDAFISQISTGTHDVAGQLFTFKKLITAKTEYHRVLHSTALTDPL